jgi:molecular chaperone DnaJ
MLDLLDIMTKLWQNAIITKFSVFPRARPSDEIKAAFRKLARQYHPDVNKEADAEEKFKEINEAYGVLSDQDKRARYDRFGHSGLGDMGGMPDFATMDFGDIFEEILGGFGFATGRQSRRSPRRGRDLQMAVTLTFEEAFFGVEKEVEFQRDETCSTCNGTGAEPGTSPTRCATCGGQGEVRQVRQTFLGQMVQTATCPTCNGRGETIRLPVIPVAARVGAQNGQEKGANPGWCR